MSLTEIPLTRMSIIAPLQNGDSNAFRVAFSRFFSGYQPLVVQWCRRFGLEENSANDVTQAIFLRLFENRSRLKTFDPTKGRFQQWLVAVIRNAVRDELRHRYRIPFTQLPYELEEKKCISMEDDVTQMTDPRVATAIARVHARVERDNWEIWFRAQIFDECRVELAEEFKKTPGAVYASIYRANEIFKEELASLDDDGCQRQR